MISSTICSLIPAALSETGSRGIIGWFGSCVTRKVELAESLEVGAGGPAEDCEVAEVALNWWDGSSFVWEEANRLMRSRASSRLLGLLERPAT